MNRPLISADALRALLVYDSETGQFTWRIDRRAGRGRITFPAGSVAGTTDPHGYVWITIDRRHYAAHRLAWLYVTGDWPRNVIDHIDRCPGNNRFANLRDTDKTVKNLNRIVANRNNRSTGALGVSVHCKSGKIRAILTVDGKQKHIGHFDSVEAAAEARQRAAEILCSERSPCAT